MSATAIAILIPWILFTISVLIIIILSLIIRSKNRKEINKKIERDEELRQKRRQIKEGGRKYEKQIINAKTPKHADTVHNNMLNDILSYFERD